MIPKTPAPDLIRGGSWFSEKIKALSKMSDLLVKVTARISGDRHAKRNVRYQRNQTPHARCECRSQNRIVGIAHRPRLRASARPGDGGSLRRGDAAQPSRH